MSPRPCDSSRAAGRCRGTRCGWSIGKGGRWVSARKGGSSFAVPRSPRATGGTRPRRGRRGVTGGWIRVTWATGPTASSSSPAGVKDLIKKTGRNLYPQEVEDVVGAIPGIRKGCVAAFGVHDPSVGTERLVVVAETRRPGALERERLRAAVMEGVVAALGVPADVVVIADPHAVLKTSSGKVRRGATRAAYLQGVMGRPGRPIAVQWARLLLGAGRGAGPRGGRPAARPRRRRLSRLAAAAHHPAALAAGAPGPDGSGRRPGGPALVSADPGALRLLRFGSRGEPSHRRGGPGHSGREPRELSRRRRPPRGGAAPLPVRRQATSWPGPPWWAA